MTDYKKLCAELLDAWDALPWQYDWKGNLIGINGYSPDDSAFERARAALAEPEPEGPTDEELESFLVDVAAEHGDIYWAEPLVLARAVLARWGRPAPQPAAGEVAELVAWLRDRAAGNDRFGAPIAAGQLNRAADLLEHLSPPQSVPVSERLPGPEDCDAEGRCWTWAIGTWRLSRINRSFHTHWLPSHTLPQPS